LALRTPAELADGDDQRLGKHTPFVEIGDQGRQAGVEHRGGLVLHPGRQALMHVPGVVVRIGHLWPVNLDEAGPRLDEPAGQQHRLAEGVQAIAFARLLLLPAQVEGVAGASGDHQAQRLAVILVEIELGGRLLQLGHPLVDGVAQPGAPGQPLRRDLLAQLEVIDADALHLLHVHVVAGRVERVGVVGPAEETGRAALADDAAFLQRTWQHDKGQHGDRGRLELDDVRAKVGEVLGAGRL